MSAAAASPSSGEWRFDAQPAAELEPFFLASAGGPSGFLGGDSATSLLWDDSKAAGASAADGSHRHYSIWLYSDTLIGKIKEDGSRQTDRMPRNSIGVFELKHVKEGVCDAAPGKPAHLQPAGPLMDHFSPSTEEKDTHKGVFSPADNRNWFWLTGGAVQVGGTLYVIAGEMHQFSEGQWGWGQWGTACLAVEVQLGKDPLTWPVKTTRILPQIFNADTRANWILGSAITDGKDGFLYLTGQAMDAANPSARDAFLTRITREAFVAAEFDKLELLTGVSASGEPNFSPLKEADDFKRAHRLFGDAPSETTIEWHPLLQRWTLLTANSFISPSVLLRTTPHLWGPWSANTPIYKMPEGTSAEVFCYSPKSHSEFAAADEIVLSYMCNGSWEHIQKNAGVYIPKMVRVKISEEKKSDGDVAKKSS